MIRLIAEPGWPGWRHAQNPLEHLEMHPLGMRVQEVNKGLRSRPVLEF